MHERTFANLDGTALDEDGEANGLRRPYGTGGTIGICHATGDPELPYVTPRLPVEILVDGALEGGHQRPRRRHHPTLLLQQLGRLPEALHRPELATRPARRSGRPSCVPPPPPVPDPDPITPVAECVELLAGGGFRAHFGYENPNDVALRDSRRPSGERVLARG